MSVLDVIRGRQVVLPLTNKSGGVLDEGDVVIQDTATDDAFTTTTSVGSELVLGVVAETIADDAAGRVITNGYAAIVEVDAATTRGQYLKTGTTGGSATPVSVMDDGVFAIALSAVGAAGQVSAFLFGLDSGRGILGRAYLTAAGGWPSTTSGCAPAALIEYGTYGVDTYVLAFDSATDEFAQWAAMLAGWNGGTITAQFIWACTGGVATQTVEWNIQGRSYGDNEAIDQAWGTAVAVIDTWQDDDTVHISSETAAVTLAGTPAVGELVLFRIHRDVSDDDLGVDAQLLMVIIKYTRS